MTMAPSQLGAFVKSDPSRETPNLQYHIQPLTLPKFGEPLDPFPAFTASVANMRPTSRGSVRITAPEPAAQPEIRPNYLVTDEDRHVAAALRARDAQHRLHAGAGEVPPRGVPPRPGVPERRGAGARPPATSPPPSSTPSAPARWAATTAAVVDPRLQGARPRRPARRRRLRHAHHHLRQHQLPDPDDRREGRRDDPWRMRAPVVAAPVPSPEVVTSGLRVR